MSAIRETECPIVNERVHVYAFRSTADARRQVPGQTPACVRVNRLSKAGMMLTQGMKDTVNKQRLGFVATVLETGEPNLSPKGTFVVVDDRTLAFGDVGSPNTIVNLCHRPAVDINFVDPLSWEGCRGKQVASAP